MKMSRIGEVEAKHGVQGEDLSVFEKRSGKNVPRDEGTEVRAKKTIKSVSVKDLGEFSPSDIEQSLAGLSKEEKAQLGKQGYPSKEVWCQLRDFLVQRSVASNPLLAEEMTAYTPSETLRLMEQKPIKKWLDNVENLRIPEEAEIVVFVPCAKTKPWKDASRGIYSLSPRRNTAAFRRQSALALVDVRREYLLAK